MLLVVLENLEHSGIAAAAVRNQLFSADWSGMSDTHQ